MIQYDLALSKTVSTADYLTGNVIYTIAVRPARASIDSGVFTVTDPRSPAGHEASSRHDSRGVDVEPPASVTWTSRPSLANERPPRLTMTLHIDNYLLSQFRNFAEISADSAAPYGDQRRNNRHSDP